MKLKLFFASFLLLLGAINLKSQDIPPPNPGLVIKIVSGNTIEFVFNGLLQYQNGINTGHPTFIRIGSIYDWKLQMKADQLVFYGTNDPAHQMELNNVGVLINAIGTNMDDGSNIINNAKFSPLPLESTDVTIMTKGMMTNKGYGIENSFIFNWEVGTQQGSMNPSSIFEQMVDGDVAADRYTVNIILTISVY